MSAVHFSPGRSEDIARWMLECPFLTWDTVTGGLPRLLVKQVDQPHKVFQIEAMLGRGGFGVVFQGRSGSDVSAIKIPMPATAGSSAGLTLVAKEVARLLDNGQAVDAEKLLTSEHAKVTTEFLRRLNSDSTKRQLHKFQRESIVLQRLRHPHLVKLQFAGQIEISLSGGSVIELPCLGMELVTGTSLRDISRKASPSLKDEFATILRVGRDMALALAAIHDMQLCHRDFSWNNVLVRDDGTPVLIDLGNVNDPEGSLTSMAGLLDNSSPEFPIALTLGFVSPEHWNSWMPTSASDQFSLGVAIYLWCMKGTAWPYQPQPLGAFDTNNPADPEQPVSLKKRRLGEVKSPGWSDSEKKVFDRFASVVDRMLHKQEVKRYPRMRDVAAEFQTLLIDLGHEHYHEFDTVELTPVNEFVELCRQVNFKTPAAPHGCLILQMLVSQARLQLSSTIENVWVTLFDTFHSSVDRGEIRWMAKALEQIDGLVNQLNTAVRVVLLPFSRTESGASMKPRFGGRFQWLLSHLKDHLTPLILRKRRCEKLFEECQVVQASDADVVRKEQSVRNASEQILLLWGVVSEMQEKLAGADYELAVYTMRLRSILAAPK